MASTELRGEAFAALPTEARNSRSEQIDQFSTLEMLTVINDEDATIAAAVRVALPQIAAVVDAVADRFTQGGRLFYVGAGTSGRLGVLDASECPPTFSVPPGLFVGLIAGGDAALRRSSEASEDSPEAGAGDLERRELTHHDTVVGIAASGRTPYVLGALARARKADALTVGLTCAGGAEHPSPVAGLVRIAIELATGPEVLTGSTRMKAGTATKMVLNMISTGVMIRRGAVFSNLMVNVQPTNEKLVDRAVRIIAAVCRVTKEDAARLLEEGSGVKVAIMMQKLSLSKEEAERRLSVHGGRLTKALNNV